MLSQIRPQNIKELHNDWHNVGLTVLQAGELDRCLS